MSNLPDETDRLGTLSMQIMRPSLKSLALRGLLGGAIAGSLAALAFANVADAQPIAGFNSNLPVSYSADRIELQDRQHRVILSGNVVIKQGNLQLDAQRTTVAYTNDNGVRIQRIDATGNVRVSRGDEHASGAAGVYDFARKVIILSGGVSFRRGANTLNGGRLVIDLNSGISSVDGNSVGNQATNGRVSGTFQVKQ